MRHRGLLPKILEGKEDHHEAAILHKQAKTSMYTNVLSCGEKLKRMFVFGLNNLIMIGLTA